jgi:hypothetical protein
VVGGVEMQLSITDTEFAMYREAQRLLTGVNAGLAARGESASFRVTVANDAADEGHDSAILVFVGVPA